MNADTSFVNTLPPRRYISTVSRLIETQLHEHGMFMPAYTLEAFVTSQIEALAATHNISQREAVKRFPDANDYASGVATQLLTDVAEERPGTEGWRDQDGIIPVTLSRITSTLSSLALSAQFALENDALNLLAPIQYSLAGMSLWLQEQVSNSAHSQPVILAPQPGLATVVRLLRCAGEELMSGRWNLDLHEDVEPSIAALRFWADADALNELKVLYGTNPNATSLS